MLASGLCAVGSRPLEPTCHVRPWTCSLTAFPDIRRLQRLELGFCGRGFGDEAAAEMAAAAAAYDGGVFPELESVALGGAYRLSDEGLGKVGWGAGGGGWGGAGQQGHRTTTGLHRPSTAAS